MVLRQPALARFLPAALLVWSASLAIDAYYSIHLAAIGGSGQLIGAAWAVVAAVEVPIMWAYPALAARFGTERLLVVGTAALLVRAVAVSFLADPLLVAATMVLYGIGTALLIVGGVTYVARHAPAAAAASAQGILSATAFSLSIIIGPGLASIVVGGMGVPATFMAASLALLAGLVAMAVAVRPSPVANTLASIPPPTLA